ncbi:MAG: ATP-binding protein, partial [Acidimicrobiia bacterium]
MTREHLTPSCPPHAVDNAALVVTELVTNAVRHADTEMLLVLDVASGHIDVRVQDESPELPRPRDLDPGALSGRGLALVEALSTAWGVEERAGTKVVWATIPLERDATEHEDGRNGANDGEALNER